MYSHGVLFPCMGFMTVLHSSGALPPADGGSHGVLRGGRDPDDLKITLIEQLENRAFFLA